MTEDISLSIKKAQLRKLLIQKRNNLTKSEVEQASWAVVDPVIAHLRGFEHRIKTAHVYAPFASGNEIDTMPLVTELRKRFPAITIIMGEPRSNAPFPEQSFDLMIVPVLGFDPRGYRLGMGGGWYDQWLAMQPHAMTVGLAYTWSEVTELPNEVHDLKLNAIIAV